MDDLGDNISEKRKRNTEDIGENTEKNEESSNGVLTKLIGILSPSSRAKPVDIDDKTPPKPLRKRKLSSELMTAEQFIISENSISDEDTSENLKNPKKFYPSLEKN